MGTTLCSHNRKYFNIHDEKTDPVLFYNLAKLPWNGESSVSVTIEPVRLNKHHREEASSGSVKRVQCDPAISIRLHQAPA